MSEATNASENNAHPTSPTRERVASLLDLLKVYRAEIGYRTDAQTKLEQLNLATLGLIAGSSFVTELGPSILFLIPILAPVIGLRWLDHASCITRIGNFIMTKVIPPLEGYVGDLPDYEKTSLTLNMNKFERRSLLAFPILVMFGAVPFVALLFPFSRECELSLYMLYFFALPGTVLTGIFVSYWQKIIWIGPPPRPGADNDRPGAPL